MKLDSSFWLSNVALAVSIFVYVHGRIIRRWEEKCKAGDPVTYWPWRIRLRYLQGRRDPMFPEWAYPGFRVCRWCGDFPASHRDDNQ